MLRGVCDGNERLLGFDARVDICGNTQAWASDRMDGYMYKLDVETRLSVDEMVWPAVPAARLEGWSDFVYFQNIWSDLSELNKHVGRERGEAHKIIAVSLCMSEQQTRSINNLSGHPQELAEYGVREAKPFTPIEPRAVKDEWELLGYDVCDSWLLSGLSNCGFQPEKEDVNALRNTWGTRLNRYHLFQDYNDASEFTAFSDSRVPEHAPFFVYGLWLL